MWYELAWQPFTWTPGEKFTVHNNSKIRNFGPLWCQNHLTLNPSPKPFLQTLKHIWWGMFIVLARWHSLCSCNKVSHKCGIIHLYQSLYALCLTVMSLSQPQVAALVRRTDNHFNQYTLNLFVIPFEFSGLKKKLCWQAVFFPHFHLPSKVRRGRRLTF